MHPKNREGINPKEAEKLSLSFPDFDELMKLAKEDPLALEALRIQLCSQLIDNAPEHYQHRLQGLQFTIDMERQRSGSSYKTCLRISQMMNDALHDLSKVITNPEEFAREKKAESCEVIPLF